MRHDDSLRELAAQQFGYVTLLQARRLGLRESEVARLDRDWDRATDRVLHLRGAPPVRGSSVALALLDQGGDAAASHDAGAWWWGVGGFGARPPHLVTTSSSRRHTSLAVVHEVRRVPDQWVTVLHGLRVVRPELLVLQLAAIHHPKRAERAFDNLWRDRLLSGASVDRLLADLGRRGRNGTAVLREIRAARPDDYVPPASNLEARTVEVLADLGLTFRLQVDSGGEVHWTGRVDLRERVLPLIVEVQSEKYHSALLDRVADAARRARLEADGFVVIEVTDNDVWFRPDQVRREVAAGARLARSVVRGVTPA